MGKKVKFGINSVFHKLPEKMYVYSREQLSNWSTLELLRMHYHLTKRLDGYGHLNADQSIKDNCALFRKILHERNIDAVRNCILNEMYYDWGYRHFVGVAPELGGN